MIRQNLRLFIGPTIRAQKFFRGFERKKVLAQISWVLPDAPQQPPPMGTIGS